jgi:hypothetical protein
MIDTSSTTKIAELEEALRFADIQNKELSKNLRDALVARDTYKLSLENLMDASSGMQVGNRKSVAVHNAKAALVAFGDKS